LKTIFKGGKKRRGQGSKIPSPRAKDSKCNDLRNTRNERAHVPAEAGPVQMQLAEAGIAPEVDHVRVAVGVKHRFVGEHDRTFHLLLRVFCADEQTILVDWPVEAELLKNGQSVLQRVGGLEPVLGHVDQLNRTLPLAATPREVCAVDPGVGVLVFPGRHNLFGSSVPAGVDGENVTGSTADRDQVRNEPIDDRTELGLSEAEDDVLAMLLDGRHHFRDDQRDETECSPDSAFCHSVLLGLPLSHDLMV